MISENRVQHMQTGLHCDANKIPSAADCALCAHTQEEACTYIYTYLLQRYLLDGACPVEIFTFPASDLHSYIPLCAYGAVTLGRHV